MVYAAALTSLAAMNVCASIMQARILTPSDGRQPSGTLPSAICLASDSLSANRSTRYAVASVTVGASTWMRMNRVSNLPLLIARSAPYSLVVANTARLGVR